MHNFEEGSYRVLSAYADFPCSASEFVLAVLDSQDPIVSYAFLKFVSERSQLVMFLCKCGSQTSAVYSRCGRTINVYNLSRTSLFALLEGCL